MPQNVGIESSASRQPVSFPGQSVCLVCVQTRARAETVRCVLGGEGPQMLHSRHCAEAGDQFPRLEHGRHFPALVQPVPTALAFVRIRT